MKFFCNSVSRSISTLEVNWFFLLLISFMSRMMKIIIKIWQIAIFILLSFLQKRKDKKKAHTFSQYIFFYKTIFEIICIFIRAYHFIDFQDIFILCSSWDELILSYFQVKIFQSMGNIWEPVFLYLCHRCVCGVNNFLSFQLHEICKII